MRLGLSDNEFKAFPVNGDDLNSRIIFQNLSDFAQIHIHGTCIEIAIVTPDLLEGMASVDQLIYF
jgi:hypothetical protein